MSKFLEQAFLDRDTAPAQVFYDGWAPTYEADVTAQGYETPTRCADALAAHTTDLDAPILDFGCGTGLAGMAFRQAGFRNIDGVDISPAMLVQAGVRGLYRSLQQIEEKSQIGSTYPIISAVGVIGPGSAPGTTIDVLMHALPKGGKLVFSFNDYALADPLQTGRLNEWIDCSAAQVLFADHGPHLTAQDMSSTVYIVEKY